MSVETHRVRSPRGVFASLTRRALGGAAFGLGLSAAAMTQPSFPPAPVVALSHQPLPRLLVDQPLAEQLAMGLVVIYYRAENLRIVPVFGPAARQVSPRIGHIHVTVDEAAWHWADASGEPLILQGLPPGRHRILIELADPTHRILDHSAIELTVPPTSAPQH